MARIQCFVRAVQTRGLHRRWIKACVRIQTYWRLKHADHLRVDASRLTLVKLAAHIRGAQARLRFANAEKLAYAIGRAWQGYRARSAVRALALAVAFKLICRYRKRANFGC